MLNTEIRELRAGDLDSLLECQRAAFGDAAAKTRAEWLWAFQRPNMPVRHIVAVQGERVIASYAGLPQRMWIGGEERICVQPVDLMVHPEFRQGLRHRGLYVEIAEEFLGRYGTRGTDVLHFGWPIDAARRIGERQLEYEFVREELALVRDLAGGQGEFPSGVREVEVFDERIKWLWDRCASEWGAAIVRDATWLRWRFAERPNCDYVLLGAYDEDLLIGLAVLRKSPWTWTDCLPLCDWLVPPGELAVAADLERAVRVLARRAGASSLVALFPDSSAPFATFQELGWRVVPSPYCLLARSFDGRFDGDWLRSYWWYSLADSDLV